MNKIMTNIKDIQSKIINNFLGGENGEYAIFARTVKAGVGLAGGVAGAYAMYNNAESIIQNGGFLSEYVIESIRAPYALEIVSLGAGVMSYAATSCIGVPICYAMMKLAKALEGIIRYSFKISCFTIPMFLINFVKMIGVDLLNNVRDIIKLAFEWRSATSALVLLGVAMYTTPQLAWEGFVWCYENYDFLAKSFESVDRSKFLLKSLCIMAFCFLTENGISRLVNIKDFIKNNLDLMMLLCKREYYRIMSGLIVIGLIIYNTLEMNVNLFSELYHIIRNDG